MESQPRSGWPRQYAMLAGFVAIILVRTVIAQDTQPTPPREGDRDFQRIQDEQRLRQDRDVVLMKAYLDAARGALAAQDAKKAEESVLQALKLRPNDPDALELFRQVMAVQGV